MAGEEMVRVHCMILAGQEAGAVPMVVARRRSDTRDMTDRAPPPHPIDRHRRGFVLTGAGCSPASGLTDGWIAARNIVAGGTA